MNISFNSYPILSNNYKRVSPQQKKIVNNSDSVCFGSKLDKKLTALLASENNLGKFKMTFDEAVRIYNKWGYNITRKTGSHAQINIPGMEHTIPLVDPHNGETNLAACDLKKMILILTGRAKEAMFVK